ncbi:hypothetical protein BD289DRAFT_421345 [Coniella lustricola]|uniref:Histone acetyltransferase n=1 Tax=Coniella lustricola TaxID=2025994 RepID=A0A2T3AM47_9PEZI|nr:hypothetical protein BD289DRAFT_421345 [Coniella lustricola]
MGSLSVAQQLMEEELQQSVRESEENLGYGSDEDAPGEDEDIEMDDRGEVYCEDDEDAPGEDDPDAPGEEVDEEPEGGDEPHEGSQDESEEQSSDQDAEAENDDNFEDAEDGSGDEAPVSTVKAKNMSENSEDEGEDDSERDDEEEGVGAVKLRPGETDDEEEEEDANESDGSEGESFHAESDAVSEGEADWDEDVDNAEEDEEGDESEAEPAPVCIFCKEDEETDPLEKPGGFLACSACGENAHQQCARDQKALRTKQSLKSWRCPECADVSEVEDEEEDGEEEDINEHEDVLDLKGIVNANSPPATRRATAPKLARDLLPSQRGALRPDSHSMFNQLVLDDDPMDGSRVLRKRKTSSIADEELITNLRKRHQGTDDSHSVDGTVATNVADEESRPRSSRSLRLKIPTNKTNKPVAIVKKTRSKLIVKFRSAPAELKKILSKKPKLQKRNGRRATSGRSARVGAARGGRSAATPPLASFPSSVSQPFYSFFDKDVDDRGRPYGGILTEAEADTSKTLPVTEDRRRFDEAKQKAEEDWKERLLQMQAEVEAPVRKSKKSAGPASQIECIEFGGWEIDTWYAAPYPEEYSRNRVLFICEFCLKYMNSDYVAWRHKLKCPAKHPPGDEIYRSGSVSVFEVDGRKNPVYCQNLCLLAKLFLGSKTLYYDVEPFLFYVLCEYDDLGYHFVGYFSKEKRASSQNNVSCILTLPIHQRKGYGNLLIDFSYLLTRVEGKCGSPEKPLSDMGLVSYRNYWRLIMCRYLLGHVSEDRYEKKGLSIRQISDDTGMTADDVISALEGLRCLVRDPQTQLYAFRVDINFCKEYVAKWESKQYVQLDPSALTWTPYVMGRSNATNFELAPAIHAIAPREEDEEQKASDVVMAEVVDANGETVQVPYEASTEVDEIGEDTIKEDPVIESTELNDLDADDNPADQPTPSVEGNKQTVPKVETAEHAVPAEATEPDSIEDTIEQDEVAENESFRDQIKDVSEEDKENSWIALYDNIPPTRFVVFPPAHGGRRATNRPSVARPPVSRTTSVARPRARRPAARPAARPRTRNSGSRSRKPGGTGRGPGRWPKGTKKSDYGNADSGPGLPPSWADRPTTAGTLEAVFEPIEDGDMKAMQEEADRLMSRGNSPIKVNGTGRALTSSSSGSSSSSGGENDDNDDEDDHEDTEDGDGDDDVVMQDTEAVEG